MSILFIFTEAYRKYSDLMYNGITRSKARKTIEKLAYVLEHIFARIGYYNNENKNYTTQSLYDILENLYSQLDFIAPSAANLYETSPEVVIANFNKKTESYNYHKVVDVIMKTACLNITKLNELADVLFCDDRFKQQIKDYKIFIETYNDFIEYVHEESQLIKQHILNSYPEYAEQLKEEDWLRFDKINSIELKRIC